MAKRRREMPPWRRSEPVPPEPLPPEPVPPETVPPGTAKARETGRKNAKRAYAEAGAARLDGLVAGV
ncbi:MAG: hypothetical protein OZ948_19850, partial [Deltaproteobacteria bacterium]|nr:hypothetical protein [Deltaproteobacteria bacterium]